MGDCFKRVGVITPEERELSSFSIINVLDHIDVIITQDTINRVTVEGGENLIPLVTTDVINDTLHIRNNNTCDWVRNYDHRLKVHVSVTSLHHFIYGASGNVSTTNAITTPNFLFEQRTGSGSVKLTLATDTVSIVMHTGTGDFTLTGQTDYAYLFSGCYSWIDASNLKARAMLAHDRGSGDFIVNVSDVLHATIESTGSVRYIGEPLKLTSTIIGKGQLTKEQP